MDDTLRMSDIEGPGQHRDECGRLVSRQGPAPHPFAEVAAVGIFEDEIRLRPGRQIDGAEIVDLHEVRMAELRHRLPLAEETSEILAFRQATGEDHLDGDGAIQLLLHRPEDDTHPAATELLRHPVTRQMERAR